LQETKEALELSQLDDRLYSTAGIHPTRCGEFPDDQADTVLAELIEVAKKGKEMKKIVAIGEFGLDYDRLHFCDKEVVSTNLLSIVAPKEILYKTV
jgi:TatD DNase family protein